MTEKIQKAKLNVCFVSPHPDDIELYCGGALLAHTQNDNVYVIMMTKGGMGKSDKRLKGKPLEAVRENEAIERYSLLDNVQLIFAGFYDQNVTCDSESQLRIINILKEFNPDIIYIPEFHAKLSLRGHCDHLNTGKLILESSNVLDKSVLLRCYHSNAVNFLMNIDEFYELNNTAIQFYRSQLGITRWPFMTRLSLLSHRYNKKRAKWGKKIGCEYAEGFRELCINNLTVTNP